MHLSTTTTDLVLVDGEGCVIDHGALESLRKTLSQFLNSVRSLHGGRYAAMRFSTPLHRVTAGDVVEIRAGATGSLWERFTILTDQEWRQQSPVLQLAA